MREMVNHPKHYNKDGRKECIEEMIDIFGLENTIIWSLMTAYKYRYRLGDKDAVEQENGKILWYEQWADKKFDECSTNEIPYERAYEVGKKYVENTRS